MHDYLWVLFLFGAVAAIRITKKIFKVTILAVCIIGLLAWVM